MELALGRVTAGKVKRGAVYRPLAFPAARHNTSQSSQALRWLLTLISLFLVSTEREAGAVIKKENAVSCECASVCFRFLCLFLQSLLPVCG